MSAESKWHGHGIFDKDCLKCRIKELEQQLAALREAARTARESLMYVLCDPEGNACIDGSSGDLSVINEALALLQEMEE